MDSQSSLEKLRSFNFRIMEEDPEIAVETADLGIQEETLELAPGPAALDASIEQESIIMRRQRPVLRVIENAAELKFADQADSEIWRARLDKAEDHLNTAILATGRINLENGVMAWVGTGWLIRPDIIVTNRHVADLFTEGKGAGFSFTTGFDGRVRPDIDFLKEFESRKTRRFRLIKPLYVVPKPGPDIAFFEVEQTSDDGKLSTPITLAKKVKKTKNAAVIGYPAYDSRIPDIELMERIYGSEYNKKRLAPGSVTRMDATRIMHDCTTLGGNSGSTVLDLDSGEALGLHFSGAFMRSNYAVRADIVERALQDVLGGRRPYAETRPDRDVHPRPARPQAAPQTGGGTAGATASLTVPLTISVSLGPPSAGAGVSLPYGGPSQGGGDYDDDEDIEDIAEAPEDYLDREGYKEDFLGDGQGFICPLPEVVRAADDVLEFDFDGVLETELRYQHFSVVMNRPRRMCFFSAVNINGKKSKRASRKGWRWDPRIPRAFQIMKECYGRPPKFSRGHMTRRNDPSWGDSQATAARGNVDSMHVTNATPQMQAFNSPIWLELEDYALDNAIDDDMKISVFTGPVFKRSDPIIYGVKIPVSFWKVIAFIHDETGEVSATGYKMNQRDVLPSEDEFVFGGFTSSHTGVAAQVSIRSIERETGLSFGPLRDLDPFGADESFGAPARPQELRSARQIRFY